MSDGTYAADVRDREEHAGSGPWPVDPILAGVLGRCPWCWRLNPADPCVCEAQQPCDPFGDDKWDEEDGQPPGSDPRGPASRDVGTADADDTKERR